ncbi:hypothetical protein Goari_010471 [Gossypium aridum]|uniref:Uncharacterized protein n=1 Tax=Gossypium aridum TaxID=34290 RepID=A0A7J8Y049_GOSAI|nr:hypothetical protein [Gossypium aridum]
MAEDGGDDSSVGDRNTKKGASWRDKVLGIGTDDSRGEEGFEFLEGDIVKSSVNGILAISFSDRIQQILVRNMASIVVAAWTSGVSLYEENLRGNLGSNSYRYQARFPNRQGFERKEKTKEPSSEVGKTVESSESFVPWMLVERRTWRNSRAR